MALIPALRKEGRSRRFSDSEASLVYRDNSRTVKVVIQRNPIEERGRHSKSKYLRKSHAVSVVPSSYMSSSSLLEHN